MATRREFAKVVALAALSGATPAAGAEPAAVADALTSVVRAQSGAFLDGAEMKRVQSDFKEYASYLETFRAFKLTNSDEPDVTFTALTKRWL